MKTLFLAITGLSYLKVPNSTSSIFLREVLTVLALSFFLKIGLEIPKNGTNKKVIKINDLVFFIFKGRKINEKKHSKNKIKRKVSIISVYSTTLVFRTEL